HRPCRQRQARAFGHAGSPLMSIAKAEDLAALTARLADLIEQDIVTLKGKRPADLAQHDNDRATVMLHYAKAAAEFKTPAQVAPLPAPVKQQLKLAAERLHKAMKEHARLLTRFRHVTEGVIKAIADGVAARETPPAYAKTGTFAKPKGPARIAMTFN